MRLSLSVLLVSLALCCYEANAVVCPSLAIDLSGFLFTIDSVYKLQLQKYVAPQEVVEAKLQVKQCTNEISFGNRVLITETLGKILFKCGYNDLSNLLS
ncbi:secretoglobin family 1D member-like isoform X2 [Diceros bicornis minor]|uniref:secretoglobin family 1D member-like isoform X2 n=1 Tax=Diceros bicornis minor TaxID=77932 RepID=UPI0026EA82F1|nr:secretoglobin family 1D member-like isoform X2 [Diceros bicornis minor]